MRKLAPEDLSGLRWLPRAGPHLGFDLLAVDDPVGELLWTKGRGSLAAASIGEEHWTLKRSGFLNPHVTVRKKGEETEIARLTLHWRSSQLEVSGDGSFRLSRRGTLLPTWEFSDGQGRRVLHVEAVQEHSKLAGGLVSVTPLGNGLAQLEILIAVAWYFVVMEWAEEETASATAGALVAVSG